MADRPKCFGKMNPNDLTPCVNCLDVGECWVKSMLTVKEASGEYADFPTASQHRMAITSAIPYHWWWQINNLKLMLNDLKDLKEKHKVLYADDLYVRVYEEAEVLCHKMWENVWKQVKQRKKVAE